MSAKKEVEEFMDSLDQSQKDELFKNFQEVLQKQIDEEVELKESLQFDLDELITEEREMWNQEREMKYSDEKYQLTKTRMGKKALIDIKQYQLMNQENVVLAISNGGGYNEITDKKGHIFSKVPDFRRIGSEYISFDENNVLITEKPVYIPIISEDYFRIKGYLLEAIRLENDTYITAVAPYSDKSFHSGDSGAINSPLVLLTLDQLVLTYDYYYTKAKALSKKEAEERTERSEAHYDSLSEERRRAYMFQRNIYSALPAKAKKSITKEEFDALNLEEREAIYKPFKKYGSKKLKSKLEDNKMWVTFHEMYERFIDPTAVPPKAGYGHADAFKYWYSFRGMMDFKIKDIRIQRADLAESYNTAIETSFGESNTSIELKEKYGILIKRQNGDKIKPIEANQIQQAWVSVQKIFGGLKPNALKYSLKISHSGKRLIFASKAIGVFIPSMGTIGVSDKYGFHQFESTMSHETAHFIDYFIGQLNNKRWATDDFESLAGRIAFTFRNNMNKPKSEQTDYINATKECFARALQQYFGMMKYGEEAVISHSYKQLDRTVPIYNVDHFVSQEKFNTLIKPLIQEFFKEQIDVFETTFDLDGTDDIASVDLETPSPVKKQVVKESVESISDVISGLEVLLETLEESEQSELLKVIEGLKLIQ